MPNPYPEHDYLYKNNAFVVKRNLKAKLDQGDQEYPSQKLCYQYIKSYRNAIDIGARYGGWSRLMEQKFQHLYAFEPRKKWVDLYPINIKMDHTTLFHYGLGAQEEKVNMQGNRIVLTDFVPDRILESQVEIRTLDQFKLKDIDFIKIDTDGYELKVLLGGTKTILKWKPIICMEMIDNEIYQGKKAEDYLLELGAKKFDALGQNSIYGW